jgi:hypothetical protein
MPHFTLGVVVEDETAMVTVEIVPGSASAGFDTADLDGLIAIYPAEALDDQGRLRYADPGIRVRLDRIEDGVYSGQVAIPAPGSWVAVPFPGIQNGVRGPEAGNPNPGPLVFEVGRPVTSWLMLAVIGSAAVGLVAVGVRDGGGPF